MLTILLVEDDETIAFALQCFFEQKNVQCICCGTVEQAKTVLTPAIGLVLLDWNLPDGTGVDLYKAIKSVGDIPIIFLTVHNEETDVVQGLDMGADDYVTKPFQLSVLWSRINAVLRRTNESTEETPLLCCGQLRLDKDSKRVWTEEKEVFLTATEYRLLLTLMEHKNRTLTRNTLLERLWDMDGEFVEDNTLTVAMKRLREKLENPPNLRTLRGLGYRLEDNL